jgi:hypothetical protein
VRFEKEFNECNCPRYKHLRMKTAFSLSLSFTLSGLLSFRSLHHGASNSPVIIKSTGDRPLSLQVGHVQSSRGRHTASQIQYLPQRPLGT